MSQGDFGRAEKIGNFFAYCPIWCHDIKLKPNFVDFKESLYVILC